MQSTVLHDTSIKRWPFLLLIFIFYAPHIYLFLSQGIWVGFSCPALFFHKSLKRRAESSSHLPHLAEILLVWMCHTVLKCTLRCPRLLVDMAESSRLLHWAYAEKVHEMFIKLNHSLEGGKKSCFLLLLAYVCICSWFFGPLVPSIWLFFRIYDVCKAIW